MNWIYKGKEVDSLDQLDTDNPYGFVYKITNLNNDKIYIGKKKIFSKRKKKFGKRRIAAMEDKRKKKWEWQIKETNWQVYQSSSKDLLSDIENGAEIRKEILKVVDTKAKLTYFETKYQFVEEVLENNSYNSNILGKFYPKIFE